MQSFGARFPRVYMDSSFKGWFVSTLLICMSHHANHSTHMNVRSLTVSIAAWFGSLINGPIVDRLGRKLSINLAVVVFVIGSAIQCGAVNIPMLFAGTHPHWLTFPLPIPRQQLTHHRTCNCRRSRWPTNHGGTSVYLRSTY